MPSPYSRSRHRAAFVMDCVIAVSCLLTLWQLHLPAGARSSVRSTAEQAPPIDLGGFLALPGVDWTSSDKTVVVPFTLGCHLSIASAPFYQTLSQHVARRGDQRLIIVAPEPEADVSQWMHANGISEFHHVRQNFILVGLRLTPTVAVVNRNGIVTDLAVGKLDGPEEEHILARLSGQSPDPVSFKTELYKQAWDKR